MGVHVRAQLSYGCAVARVYAHILCMGLWLVPCSHRLVKRGPSLVGGNPFIYLEDVVSLSSFVLDMY
jgi:hypothetical protein